MTRWVTIILLACGTSALAQSASDKAVFVPSDGISPAKVVYFETGTATPVLRAKEGEPPDDCPEGSFWELNSFEIVSCDDGSVYGLTSYSGDPDLVDMKAMGLKYIGPRPGTDDPGPMINPETEGDTK